MHAGVAAGVADVVEAGAAGHAVGAVERREAGEVVVAVAAGQHVVARPARDLVGAGGAADRVVARARTHGRRPVARHATQAQLVVAVAEEEARPRGARPRRDRGACTRRGCASAAGSPSAP